MGLVGVLDRLHCRQTGLEMAYYSNPDLLNTLPVKQLKSGKIMNWQAGQACNVRLLGWIIMPSDRRSSTALQIKLVSARVDTFLS